MPCLALPDRNSGYSLGVAYLNFFNEEYAAEFMQTHRLSLSIRRQPVTAMYAVTTSEARDKVWVWAGCYSHVRGC